MEPFRRAKTLIPAFYFTASTGQSDSRMTY
jgi:hypothetical protein